MGKGINLYSWDGYIGSHYLMGYEDIEYATCYMEARVKDAVAAVFGFQKLIQELEGSVDFEMTPEDETFFKSYGMPAHVQGFRELLVDYPDGTLPLHIQVIEEGTVMRTGIPMLQITNTDPKYSWLVGLFEDYFLNAWAPCSVSTQSWAAKHAIMYGMMASCDNDDKLPFMLNDFGMRACQSLEVAGILGQGHLVHFMGTDNTKAVRQVQIDYETTKVYGATICATAHSVMTLVDADKELPFVRGLLEKFINGNIDGTLAEGTIPGWGLAMVIDSYDDENFVKEVFFKGCADLIEIIKKQGKTIVLRPDSGDATSKVIDVMNWIEECIPNEITVNTRGFKKLPPHITTIQGDGMSILTDGGTLPILIKNVVASGWALDNTCFGSGGALLNGCNRDTLGFAFKLSAVKRKGSDAWEGVGKLTPGKVSKRGRLAVVEGKDGQLECVNEEDLGGRINMLVDLYYEGLNGEKLLSFSEVQSVAGKCTPESLCL